MIVSHQGNSREDRIVIDEDNAIGPVAFDMKSCVLLNEARRFRYPKHDILLTVLPAEKKGFAVVLTTTSEAVADE